MSKRALSGALLGVALLLHFGYTVETWRAASAEQQAYARARTERTRLEARIADLARAEAAWRTAAGNAASAPGGAASDPLSWSGQAPGRLREAVLSALEGSSLGSVHIGIDRGRGPVAARLSLTAAGSFQDVVRFSGRLVGPGTGVVLERVRITPAAGNRLDFAVRGVSLGARP